ncbi:MAG: ribosome maturation factor RimM [Bacteroidales bacterium]|nr:ribosome maturation factor RimM [Bacteroidales bacterium]MDD3893042.1 ribosome maturation factor RimM [Bacteroidales bacterium]
MNHIHLTEVGTIQRTHGVNGEVQVLWFNYDPLDHKLESVFLRIEGIPIPFAITTIRGKGQKSIVKFDEVDGPDMATNLVGLTVLSEIKQLEVSDELYLDDLVGYSVVNQNGNLLGEIEQLQDFSGNLVFLVVDSAGKELLIPAASDFIVELNEDTKTLLMQLPDGLVDL